MSVPPSEGSPACPGCGRVHTLAELWLMATGGGHHAAKTWVRRADGTAILAAFTEIADADPTAAPPLPDAGT